jgi:transcriptional/translational regulatory protein YebC/TACO1
VGQILLAPGVDEDQVMEAALEAGAEDVIADEEGGIEVLTAPADFEAVRDALAQAGFTAEVAEITMRADVPVVLSGDDALKMQKLLDMLEDLDDTQSVYHNAELDLPA